MEYYINVAGFNLKQKKGLQSTTLDSLLISDFVRINLKSKNILEIGSGFGIISLILAKKSKANVIGVEINSDSFKISVENLKNTNIENLSFLNADILEYKNIFKEQSLDIIVSNPPYFKENNIENLKKIESLNNARFENTLSIKEIINISKYLLKNRGSLYLIFRTERFIEILSYLSDTNMIIKRMKPVYTKVNDERALISMVEIVKGASQGFVLEKPIYIYDVSGKRTEYIDNLYLKGNL